MNKYEFIGLDQELYYEKLDNGLEVFLIPYKNKVNYSMHYVTKFGSTSTEFIPYNDKKMTVVPDGIAHFLEHKMFEQEDGVDPFTFASKSGTYSNASTNYECTRYYFEGNKNFKENLDYLISFVGNPYFTDTNVEKEKGIIAEEIKQYDDNINWFLDEEIRKALLKCDKHRIDIAGTVESIYKITKEDLYKTYYTFYQPSNMMLIVSGNFDLDDACSVIKNNQTLNKNKNIYPIVIKDDNEPVNVYKKKVELTFNIFNTKVGYGIKIPVGNKDRFKLNLYLALMLEVKFGVSSLFREEMKKKKLFTSFHVERDFINDYYLISFKATSNKPLELVEMIKKELEDIDISDSDINRIKKVWISSCVMASDDINSVIYNITDNILNYGRVIYDKIDYYRKLNKKDYIDILKDIDLNNSSIVIVRPKDDNSVKQIVK